MILKQKDIVLLPYPFSDQKGNKVRPAIIISNDLFNKKTEDCIIVPLTSVIKDVSYSFIVNQEDLDYGKLLKPSRVRIDKILTIRQNLIMIKIGSINNKTLEKIRLELNKIF